VILSFYGCSSLNNATAINAVKNQNKILEKNNAPIRYKYKEYNDGIVYNPYLVGEVTSTVADYILKKDTLATIKREEKYKKIDLIQVRFLTKSESPTSVKEVWVIKNEEDKMFAYVVNFVVSSAGGTDTYINGGNIVFKEML